MARQELYYGRTVVVETDEERAARLLAQPRRWVMCEGYVDSGSDDEGDGLANGLAPTMHDVPLDYDISRLVGDVGPSGSLSHPDFDHVANEVLDQMTINGPHWSDRVEPVYGQGRYITSARYATDDEIAQMKVGWQKHIDTYADITPMTEVDWLHDFDEAVERITEKTYAAYLKQPARWPYYGN
jgi:hypothetical protein